MLTGGLPGLLPGWLLDGSASAGSCGAGVPSGIPAPT